MICEKLIDKILVDPAQKADELFIVSGYASPSIAYYHLDLIPKKVNINLIIGMCPTDGIEKGSHDSFKRLVAESSGGRFKCRYLIKPPSVHTKNYTWVNKNEPFISFTGSANYSRNAFFQKTRESLALDDPRSGLQYFKTLIPQSLDCTDKSISKHVNIYEASRTSKPVQPKPALQGIIESDVKLEKVVLELLDENGSPISRLNWGHREYDVRNLDEAYIHVPAQINRLNFFPDGGIYFNIITDDGKGFVVKRGGDYGKNLTTPYNNSILGAYFRKRLNLPSGALVTPSTLRKYGRKNVVFYKFDDDNYYLDFSSPHLDAV